VYGEGLAQRLDLVDCQGEESNALGLASLLELPGLPVIGLVQGVAWVVGRVSHHVELQRVDVLYM